MSRREFFTRGEDARDVVGTTFCTVVILTVMGVVPLLIEGGWALWGGWGAWGTMLFMYLGLPALTGLTSYWLGEPDIKEEEQDGKPQRQA